MKYFISAESVGKGHPDKICDQISDAILTAILKEDSEARVAVEVFATNRLIVIGGEVTTNSYVDVIKIAWEIILELGYNENDFNIVSSINGQSQEIKNQVDADIKIAAAGDQGIMFGYATDETENFMPLGINVAHDLLKNAENSRVKKLVKDLLADTKSQVTLEYDGNKFVKVENIVLALQHKKDFDKDLFKKQVIEHVINPTIKKYNLNDDYKLYLNSAGPFSLGGPIADTGLTGRKIIVDTYGGASRHGGGAFSGKDYTKVDRSAAYAARWVAKNLVAAKLANRIEIQLAYVIGHKKPISCFVETFGTEKISKEKISQIVSKVFDLSVQGIIDHFDLKNFDYRLTSVFGHFGKENLPWEKLDKVDQILKLI
ncbi:methionine adenosyltransferase [Mycoplasma testudineum]|uniref:Methionine adenosyltransferase n=1 Tax=Mycoplasma testudineum TaxID=244584 RepID=A0A4R6IHD7_9MOLU|nr:methionine adenosyltransferase [Mycoplasma testudineum]OYD26936.1 methionine adenosyltransferase [Mycoplasma testudineum]TDO20485.1 methionine adenosyltransferase [Mycoplasma testudineum]